MMVGNRGRCGWDSRGPGKSSPKAAWSTGLQPACRIEELATLNLDDDEGRCPLAFNDAVTRRLRSARAD
jgi:hypothetical protein